MSWIFTFAGRKIFLSDIFILSNKNAWPQSRFSLDTVFFAVSKFALFDFIPHQNDVMPVVKFFLDNEIIVDLMKALTFFSS